jgi:hypothetical protein
MGMESAARTPSDAVKPGKARRFNVASVRTGKRIVHHPTEPGGHGSDRRREGVAKGQSGSDRRRNRVAQSQTA